MADPAGSRDTQLWVVRHGETEWSRDGRHTSRTELPLTRAGEAAATSLRDRLSGTPFDLVLTSPRLRARDSARLAGFHSAEVDEDLREWDYGTYEGVTTAQIRETVPDWTVWTHPCPGGEIAEQVSERLDRLIERVRAQAGSVLCFGHSHALRGLAARWLGQPVTDGRFYRLDTATIGVLGYERETPVFVRWNG